MHAILLLLTLAHLGLVKLEGNPRLPQPGVPPRGAQAMEASDAAAALDQ